MALDTLILGPVAFTDYSPPERMPFGGDQAMVVHKLPGGRRVIDTLGPDDMDIQWHGRLWGDGAYGQALLLNALRRSGATLPLMFAGQFYLCVISKFEADIERLPMNVLYKITVVTLFGGGGFAAANAGATALALADLAAAVAL